ncbi:MAG: hypothetical protein K2O18_01145, partial [Oscillospiraceae bacterium]|nr:hypothetical protein [Oscillospiraceae bacterium]
MSSMNNCVNSECLFIPNCRWYNPAVDRGSGCKIQDEIIAAAQKTTEQRLYSKPGMVERYVLIYCEYKNDHTNRRIFYFISISDARQFMMSSFIIERITHMLPDRYESEERRTNAGKNFIYVKDGANFYNWDISPEKVWIPSEEIMSSISPVYICRPGKVLKRWGIEFNRDKAYAGAPVKEFVDAFHEHILPGNEDKWRFDSGERAKYRGNCF